jgi:hypothetical protein
MHLAAAHARCTGAPSYFDFALLRLRALFLLELFFFELFFFDELFFVWPASRRSLFTVRAAISSARPDCPRFLYDCLMCSYCRFRLELFTPLGGILSPGPSDQFVMTPR